MDADTAILETEEGMKKAVGHVARKMITSATPFSTAASALGVLLRLCGGVRGNAIPRPYETVPSHEER